jgi:hypothetical protein
MEKSNMNVVSGLIACVLLSGCAAWGAGFGFGAPAASRSSIPQGGGHYVNFSVASDNPVVTGVLVGVLLAEGVGYYLRRTDGTLVPLERVPESDANRRIGEQDCSGVVVLDRGNLRCR